MADSVQIQKVNWWHEAIIDWMLEHPDCKLYECAAHFGISQSWLSVVIHSDVFQELWKARRASHSNYVSESLTSKTQALGHLVIETMTEKIEQEKTALSLDSLKNAADTVFRSLGYGTKLDPPQNAGQQNNFFFGQVDQQVLAESRRLMDERREVIDVTPATEDDEAPTAA